MFNNSNNVTITLNNLSPRRLQLVTALLNSPEYLGLGDQHETTDQNINEDLELSDTENAEELYKAAKWGGKTFLKEGAKLIKRDGSFTIEKFSEETGHSISRVRAMIIGLGRSKNSKGLRDVFSGRWEENEQRNTYKPTSDEALDALFKVIKEEDKQS